MAAMIGRDPALVKAVVPLLFKTQLGLGSKYGKQGAVFQGPGGKFYSVQFGEDGSRKILPVEAPGADGAPGTPLTPSRGVMQVGDELVDKSTAGTVRGVGGQIAGGETAKVEGRELGELRMKLPTMRSRMQI
jgi:hypothetical protein